ncbi:hypothetical protein LguiA_024174 [Lonicera macranthoides]
MGGRGEVMKRIVRIKFPQRHPKPSTPAIPPPPTNTGLGGKASVQPQDPQLSRTRK